MVKVILLSALAVAALVVLIFNIPACVPVRYDNGYNEVYYSGPYIVDGGTYWYYNGGFYLYDGGHYRYHHPVPYERRGYYDGHHQNYRHKH